MNGHFDGGLGQAEAFMTARIPSFTHFLATHAPDLPRKIFPVITTITDDGYRRLPDAESEEFADQVVQERMHSPDGPKAPLRAAR